MKDFDDGMVAHYEADVTDAPVAAAKLYSYPGAVENGQVRGLGVEFYGDGVEPWFATFAAGRISPNAANVAMHHPDPWKACIVSKGEGYIVNVLHPSDWATVPLRPIMGALPIPDKDVLVFWSFTRFLAIGVDRVLWETPHLSWDGIRNVRFQENHLTAEVWDAPSSAWIQAAIQIGNGSSSGGSSPDLRRPLAGK